jgi:hypothetical protein
MPGLYMLGARIAESNDGLKRSACHSELPRINANGAVRVDSPAASA